MNYSIQLAAKISGVGIHAIRIWERRYKAISPPRDQAGHRTYTKEDVEKLCLLHELCKLGFAISKIANLDSEELKLKLKEHGVGDNLHFLTVLQSRENLSEVDIDQSITICFMALKAYKLDIVSNELGRLKNTLSGRDFCLLIALPLMEELGEAVARGDYSISHEHALSSILKFHLSFFLYKPPFPKKVNPSRKIIICGVEGDNHEFGILIAAALCQYYSFQFFYLGANLPAEALVDAIKFLEADMVIAGITSMVFNLGSDHLNNYLERVVKRMNPDTTLVFGCSMPLTNTMFKNKLIQIKTLEDFDSYLSKLEF